MRLLDRICFKQYKNQWSSVLDELLANYSFAQHEAGDEYRLMSSAVYSSNIEGNTIDLNSYMNGKMAKEIFGKEKEMKEIDDLVKAYQFAKENPLHETNFLKAHSLLSEELLIKSLRGKYRNEKVGVFGAEGLVYLAVEEQWVPQEMSNLFKEIETLLHTDLNTIEIFYFASMIHLRLAHIHPFRDGNGRAARLLEKWFLAKKMGEKFWQISAEKYYKTHQSEYYKNLNIGMDYYALDYEKSLPFLMMLPQSLKE
ncbi:Fic family protein [Bergeyella zoohelcum]|uniref:Fido domain-containing protein n=2 Tax=Bergeyella zoohelcum TaxID=1015 RepID=K1MMQ8_9FLAO|nr:Fic family protein [Bergeyella zoohelcum]EKB57419.1 hypothetical protein HMPREF9699_00905 [Bergeyella zoohelcum ATCC 43767]EKB58289.1 hypothetical protein HMPREF9700_02097 [Bergeyella zoohelcum CCUG 30536]SSZ55768.1 Protein involved in cell division [Bergeyella zoohelcum]SUV48910.1 Protein involved in cell division [Bergeyella zoohelcum]